MRELVEFALIIVLVVVPIRMFIAEPYIVSGVSMSQTFETGHYLVINKFWHHLSAPARGDILVFKSPVENRFYIKRVIATPGETISIKDQQVTITPRSGSSFVLQEPYASSPTYASLSYNLSESQYFVMGDNRTNSSDSRRWGPLEENLIRGEPVIRLFPFSHISLMPGTSNY